MNIKKFMLILGIISIAVGSFSIGLRGFQLWWGLIPAMVSLLAGSLCIIQSWCIKPDKSETSGMSRITKRLSP